MVCIAKAAAVFFRRQLPQLLDANAVLLHVAALVQPVFRDEPLRQRTARAFGEQSILAEQFHARRVGILVMAVARNAEITGDDALDLVPLAEHQIGRRKAGIDFPRRAFQPLSPASGRDCRG